MYYKSSNLVGDSEVGRLASLLMGKLPCFLDSFMCVLFLFLPRTAVILVDYDVLNTSCIFSSAWGLHLREGCIEEFLSDYFFYYDFVFLYFRFQ